MKQQQRGFTMIEIVMVIAILGILAAVAIPRFVDLRDDASLAATQGVAGALASAAAVNYAARNANPAKGVPVANCTDVAAALQGGVPTGYVVTAAAVAAGVAVTCTVTSPAPAKTATFTAIGIV